MVISLTNANRFFKKYVLNDIFMCGIVGYYGNPEKIIATLVGGLRRLEYRGYDSSGVAVIDLDSQVYTRKAVGKIVNLEEKLDFDNNLRFGKIGIAHTRWATHGVPSEANAHPHTSFDQKIWVVHNGIFENYQELKADLEKQGIQFKSQTDTEVIANLISVNYSGDLAAAVRIALSKVKGAFALGIFCVDEPDRLIAVKLSAPLVLGLKDNEYIIASDVSAIISLTRDVIYLEDGEMVDINNGSYQISDFVGSGRQKQIQNIDWTEEEAGKEGYEHFLLKEIMEQPKSVEDTIRGRLLRETGEIKFGGLIDIEDRLKNINKVILIGVGTSYYAAKLGEMYFEELTGISAKAEMSPEFRYKTTVVDKNTWVIVLSQSGETADTIAALQEAKKRGVLVTGIVNTVGSTISRMTEAGVYNHIGPEISVASTKAFTSQSLLLLMHAIFLGRLGGLNLSKAQQLIGEIEKLPDLISKTLKKNEEILALAKKYYDAINMFYLGRKFNYPIALEGALKIKEISYIHSEGLSGGELKHGFIALIDEKMPTIALATEDSVYEKMLSNLEEIKARGGEIVAVASEGDKNIHKITDNIIFVPKTLEELQPLINNVVLQLFAYHCSNLKGLDVDKPRNLAKSVTVE